MKNAWHPGWTAPQQPIAVYLHTPFCPSKCGYCDFNSFAMEGDIMAETTSATIAEIKRSPWYGTPAKTIFIGGGTPTHLPTEQLLALLDALAEAHPPIEGCEITSEANPGTVDASKFADMKKGGFNRVSMGAQSFHAGDLMRLGRIHQADETAAAVAAARQAGFDRLNLDLMFALPGQSRKAWEWNLDTALSLKPDHLSLYCLTIEPNTRFYRHHSRGMLDLPEDDIQTAMYEKAIEKTASAGMTQYEISNFAHPGQECLHNIAYWDCEDYASYGPGAVGCMTHETGRVRYTNFKHPRGYCERVAEGSGLWCEIDWLTPENIRTEKIMMGLRLNSGLTTQGLDLDETVLRNLEGRGWIERKPGVILLTQEGRHFCSEAALLLMD